MHKSIILSYTIKTRPSYLGSCGLSKLVGSLLVGKFVGRLAGWLVGGLVGWLVG